MSKVTLDNPSADSSLQKAACAAHAQLPDCGFILVTMPFGDGSTVQDTHVGYVSNVDREDAVAALKHLLFHWGINEEWMDKAVAHNPKDQRIAELEAALREAIQFLETPCSEMGYIQTWIAKLKSLLPPSGC